MKSAPPSTTAGERSGDELRFEASSYDTGSAGTAPRRWVGWRRHVLALAVLLGCVAVVVLARWLAATPQLEGHWAAGPAGELLLAGHPAPKVDAYRGQAVVAIAAAGVPALAVDALLLHRWPRWQVADAARSRQQAQHAHLARALDAPGARVELQLADGSRVEVPVTRRGWAGLGWSYWPLAALALALYVFAVVVVLALPRPSRLLIVAMALCQSAGLLTVAVQGAAGLGLPRGAPVLADLAVLGALDLCTAAAAVHFYLLQPRRLPHATVLALAAWLCVPAWGLLAALGATPPSWWLAQGACFVLGAAALTAARVSHRAEPNPHALILQGLAAAALLTLALVSLAVALASRLPTVAPDVAGSAAVTWHVFLGLLLLLTPLLTRRRQVLREFALLAGASTVATSLDLLFAAMFSLSAFASLTLAVFIGVGLYAAARQWVLNHLIGGSVLTTERTFEQLYRAARAVQVEPRRLPRLLADLLRELFEPLEVQRGDSEATRARVLGGGAALLVPVRDSAREADAGERGHPALVLRFARRGQRLFTVEDARLADRMVDQLWRAVAYDAAVERGRLEERQRIAQDLHDDIGARLLTLMYQAPTREMEDYIRHTLLDLKTLTRGLAASEHRFSYAAAEWKADITHRLTAAQVELGWAFEIDHDRTLSVVQWSALTRVLRELVSNALFHGHATHIDVAFRLQGRLLRLQVSDDGDGRAPAAWSHGLGLGGVRKRVKLLGGEVTWRENGGRGIVCTVRVPDFAPRS